MRPLFHLDAITFNLLRRHCASARGSGGDIHHEDQQSKRGSASPSDGKRRLRRFEERKGVVRF
ncbi:MAG: hypothetical protein ABI920_17840 [Casimicrobiaceae bacterium]